MWFRAGRINPEPDPFQLSTIAASDDHRAHPGLPHYGLTAVRASRLTRDAIFQALCDRRTYGTTGAKIILELTVNGASMGQTVPLRYPTVVTVEAYGTDRIRRIEVLRYQPGQKDFEVVHQWTPGSLDFPAKHADAEVKPGAVYYVRLEQSAGTRAGCHGLVITRLDPPRCPQVRPPEEGSGVLKFSSP